MTSSATHRRRVRGAWWSVFVVLVVIDALVTWLPFSQRASRILSDSTLLLCPILLTTVLGVMLARRLGGLDRRFWALLTLAVALEGCSEAYWTYYAAFVDPRGPSVPHWMEIGQLAALLIFLWLVASMTALGDAPHAVRVRFYLDAACLGTVLYAVSYWWVTLPLFRGLPDGQAAAAVSALYPVVGALLLGAVALMVLGWKAYRWRTWERLVTLAFVVYGVGMFVDPWLFAVLRGGPVHRGFDWISAVLGLGYYLIFMAMVYRWTDGPEGSVAKAWDLPEVKPVWLPSLYPVAMWLALVALVVLAFANGAADDSDPLTWSAMLLGVLLVARSWVSSVELAHHRAASISDALTGVFNQRYFRDLMVREIVGARESGRGFALVLFDVVDFTGVSDRLGTEAADRLLRSLAQVLMGEEPQGVSVCRLMRDDVALVVPGATEEDLVDLAHRVSARVSSDVELEGVQVQLSSGIARFPDDATDAESLQEHAYDALHLAGAAEFTDVVVYHSDVVEDADPLRRLAAERVLLHRSRLRALAAAVDRRHPDTHSHSDRVGELACALALMLDLPEPDSAALESAARLHDVGMIGVPEDVLLSPGPLGEEEMESVRQHPVLGERILLQARLDAIALTVRHHHERWDGSGYPDGLAAEGIPLSSRVLSLCDAFDAMVSPRSYRAPLTTAQAIAEIEGCAGSQFDPELAVAFSAMVSAMKR